MRAPIAPFDVVHVICGHQFHPKIFRPLDQVAIDFGLLGDAMVLQFEIEVLGAEGLFKPIDSIAGFSEVLALNEIGNFARQAAGKANQPFTALGENLFVNARLVIVALKVCIGGQLDQVAIARFVLREQHQVVINIAGTGGGLFLQAAAGRDIYFAADDRFDPLFARGLIKIDRAIHHAVVRQRQGKEL